MDWLDTDRIETINLTLLLATAAVVGTLAIYAWRRRNRAGVAAFAWLMVAIVEWMLALGAAILSPSPEIALLCGKAAYLGIACIPVALMAFVLQYASRETWLNRRRLVLLLVVPAATQAVIWTNEMHGLFSATANVFPAGILKEAPEWSPGLWFWIHTTYTYSLMLIGAISIVLAIIRSTRIYRRQALSLLLGLLPPLVTSAVYTFELIPEVGMSLLSIGFMLMGLIYGRSLFRHRLLDVVPVARETLIDDMVDAMVVLSEENHVVDMNAAMEAFARLRATRALGKPAAEVFAGRDELLDRARETTDAPVAISLERQGVRGHYDLRVSPLLDGRGRQAGRLVILRDITDRVRAEEALQQAHLALQEEKKRADDLLEVIIPISVELTKEKDLNRLLGRMLEAAKEFCNADAGTLYLCTEDDHLEFAILRNDSLDIAIESGGDEETDLPRLALRDETGQPNMGNIATYAVHRGASVNVPDAYTTDEFDFSGTRAFDARTGYRSTSFLAIPLKDVHGKVIGVLQLINALDLEDEHVIPFDRNMQQMIESFSLLAVSALEAYIREQDLQEQIEELRIEIDQAKKARQVAEITESDYFRNLREKARDLREKE